MSSPRSLVITPPQVRRFYALHGMAVGQVVAWQPEGEEGEDEPALWRVAMADGNLPQRLTLTLAPTLTLSPSLTLTCPTPNPNPNPNQATWRTSRRVS